MNKDTKLLRDKVMNIINEARYDRGYDLPFIKVRITDTVKRCKNVLGSARMGGNYIWIPASTTQRKDLVAIVLHEVLHAVCKTKHEEGCPLMDTHAKGCPDDVAWEIFNTKFFVWYYYEKDYNEELEEA